MTTVPPSARRFCTTSRTTAAAPSIIEISSNLFGSMSLPSRIPVGIPPDHGHQSLVPLLGSGDEALRAVASDVGEERPVVPPPRHRALDPALSCKLADEP